MCALLSFRARPGARRPGIRAPGLDKQFSATDYLGRASKEHLLIPAYRLYSAWRMHSQGGLGLFLDDSCDGCGTRTGPGGLGLADSALKEPSIDISLVYRAH